MEIKAGCRYDLDTMKAFIHVSMFRGKDPAKRLCFHTVVYGLLLAVIILECILLGPDPMLYLLAGCGLLVLFLLYFGYYVAPKRSYRSMSGLKDAENAYVFYADKMSVESKGEAYSGNSEIAYPVLVKVYETSAYFFVYQTKNQAFIVDKRTIVNGTAEEIRARLMSHVGKKYHICKY